MVYKLFDLKETGGLGKKLTLERNEDRGWRAVPCDANLDDTLEKLSVLHEAGACPTEIVGLAATGDYLIVKQPLCYPFDNFEEDRRIAAASIKAVVPKYSIGQEIRVIWLQDQAWCIGDLHKGNIMRESNGAPTIIDALIGPLPPELLRAEPALQTAANRARDLREGREPPPDDLFHGVSDDEL
ncbi:MAG: hypothetical protein U0984_01210 [Prosthecobacter sp.]|nr:hypothetical protein [Prosthecobacter sp.]